MCSNQVSNHVLPNAFKVFESVQFAVGLYVFKLYKTYCFSHYPLFVKFCKTYWKGYKYVQVSATLLENEKQRSAVPTI